MTRGSAETTSWIAGEQWRRRRDSNPRGPFEPNGFQDRRLQPLGHSSGCNYNLQQRYGKQNWSGEVHFFRSANAKISRLNYSVIPVRLSRSDARRGSGVRFTQSQHNVAGVECVQSFFAPGSLKLRRGIATIGGRENECNAQKSRTARMSRFKCVTLLFCMNFAVSVWGQTEPTQDKKTLDSTEAEKTENPPEKKADEHPASESPVPLFKNLLRDQEYIWTSPFRVRPADFQWAVPFAGITTGLIMTDRTFAHEATRNSHVNASETFSNVGLAFAGASSAGIYLLGRASGDPQKRETGILGGEAMLDALVVDEALKYVFQRQRPFEGNTTGRFFQGTS